MLDTSNWVLLFLVEGWGGVWMGFAQVTVKHALIFLSTGDDCRIALEKAVSTVEAKINEVTWLIEAFWGWLGWCS